MGKPCTRTTLPRIYTDEDLVLLTVAHDRRTSLWDLISRLTERTTAPVMDIICTLALENVLEVDKRGYVQLAHEPPHALPKGIKRRVLQGARLTT